MSLTTIQTTENRKNKKTYLTEREIDQLLAVAKKTRHSNRDQLLILLTFRHALRASETVELQWHQIDLDSAKIDVVRQKGSDSSQQVLQGDEIRALRKLKKDQPDNAFVFLSERGGHMTADNFLKLMKRLGKEAGFTFGCHPHMLRHSAGHRLVNGGMSTRVLQGFLGHRNIQHTVRYSKLDANQFRHAGKIIGGRL